MNFMTSIRENTRCHNKKTMIVERPSLSHLSTLKEKSAAYFEAALKQSVRQSDGRSVCLTVRLFIYYSALSM